MNRNVRSHKGSDNPVVRANILSQWTFWWMKNLFRQGYRRPLTESDIYENKPTLNSQMLTKKFLKLWHDELEKQKKPNILRVLFRAYGMLSIIMGFLYCMLETGSKVVQILSLGGLVSYFTPGQTEITKEWAWIYGAGIVVPVLLRVIVFHPYMLWSFFIGTKMRLGCSGLVYRKILRLSKVATNDGLSGRAINILSNDLGMFDPALTFIHDLYRGPIEALLFGYLMYREIGVSAWIGVGFMLLFLPMQAWAAKKTATYRQRAAERTDVRVKLMNEIIQGIQVIKMYAWEKSFADVIAKIRKIELSAIRGGIYIQAALNSIYMISGISVFFSLVSYVLFGNPLTAKKVFTVSTFFNALSDSFVQLWPMAMTFWAQSYVSAKRVGEFLLEKEGTGYDEQLITEKGKPVLPKRVQNSGTDKKSLVFENVSAYWNAKEADRSVAIKNASFVVNEGQLMAVIGPVGAGKSSLLNVIIGELGIEHGAARINGRISYACQENWVFEGTIKDNIVFIEEFDKDRYNEVIKVCALEQDFEQLPYGDQTVVGERGISLSGGQKARVNLARAIYKKANIYLLDDPLSAVDTHVGRQIFEKCIKGYLKDKICVLVTHQLQFLKEEEHVLFISGGEIQVQGSFAELQNMEGMRFLGQSHDESGMEKEEPTEMKELTIEEKSAEKKASKDESNDRKEQQAEGTVGFEMYKAYFRSMDSYLILFIIFSLFLTARTVLSGVDYFLSRWVDWEKSVAYGNASTESNGDVEITKPFDEERKMFVMIYSILLVVGFVLFLSRTYGFFMMCLRISLKLHDKVFRSVTRATMRFFNKNSSGRILNRFSRDIFAIDSSLPSSMLICFGFFMDMTAILIIVAIANYWLLIPAIIVLIVFYFIRDIYVCTSRSLKRVESLTRSPLYSHTNQTFQGLTTIRAYGAQSILEKEFHAYQNINTSSFYLFAAANRALGLWLDLVCILYIAVVTFSFLLMENQFDSGDVGLAIMNCINMVGLCQWGMRQTAEVENQMTSVERVIEYTQITPEPALETEEKHRPDKNWPQSGRIVFKNVSMKYDENKDYILRNLSFAIKAREKVGVVGRTGAGKSSIVQALFRLAINEGVTEIDAVNTDLLGLHDLRSKVSIIPQDPVLFSGTLRYNLDPFGTADDQAIWKALEDVELKNYVKGLNGGLEHTMSDGGSNFSMGQRQLVCLARAILRNNRILILDEATANVDPETDQFIQNTIRTKFANCTVLTIAHRLHTVMDSDRIIVMDNGRAVEVGHPYSLLTQKDGYLKHLVEKTGATTAAALLDIAKSNFEKKFVISSNGY